MQTPSYNNSSGSSKPKYTVIENEQSLSFQELGHNLSPTQHKLCNNASKLVTKNDNSIIVTKPIVDMFSNATNTTVGRYYKIELTCTNCSEVFSYQHLFFFACHYLFSR